MKNYNLILLISLSSIIACTHNTIFSNYYTFYDNKWHADSTIVFNFKTQESKDFNFNLSINYTRDYPYQNFYTSYSLLDSSQNIIKSKLIEFDLFEKKYGTPLGSGILKNYRIDSLIFNINSLDENAEYTFLIKQSMRKEILKGINSIGLIVNHHQN